MKTRITIRLGNVTESRFYCDANDGFVNRKRVSIFQRRAIRTADKQNAQRKTCFACIAERESHKWRNKTPRRKRISSLSRSVIRTRVMFPGEFESRFDDEIKRQEDWKKQNFQAAQSNKKHRNENPSTLKQITVAFTFNSNKWQPDNDSSIHSLTHSLNSHLTN